MKKLILALSLFLSTPALAQNYQATQGSGTTFGTKLVGGVNFPQFTMCDPTTPANCVAVNASGQISSLQAGTWTVQPGNTANTTAWLVTGTGGTFPSTQSGTWNITNISGTVSLPTGAATSALQTSAAAAKGEGATGAAVPSGAQYSGINIGGNLTGWTGATRGSQQAASVQIVDGSGNQITTFGGSGGTASNFGSAFPSSGTAVGFTDGTNMQPGRLKAASTAPVATDPSIVVTTSPNSPDATFLGAQADSVCGTATGTCSLSALIKFLNTAATSDLPSVTGPLAAGTAVSTKALMTGGQYLSTQPTMTNTQQVGSLVSSRGEVLVSPGVSGFAVTVGAGSNIIGNVRIDQTTPGTTNGVQVNAALPAGANNIGDTGTSFRAAKLTPTPINFSSSGDNTVITRVTGTIKVYMLQMVCASAVSMDIKNGASTSFTGGAMSNVTQVFLPLSSEPYYTTTSTNNFVINIGSAVTCRGTAWGIDS